MPSPPHYCTATNPRNLRCACSQQRLPRPLLRAPPQCSAPHSHPKLMSSEQYTTLHTIARNALPTHAAYQAINTCRPRCPREYAKPFTRPSQPHNFMLPTMHKFSTPMRIAIAGIATWARLNATPNCLLLSIHTWPSRTLPQRCRPIICSNLCHETKVHVAPPLCHLATTPLSPTTMPVNAALMYRCQCIYKSIYLPRRSPAYTSHMPPAYCPHTFWANALRPLSRQNSAAHTCNAMQRTLLA